MPKKGTTKTEPRPVHTTSSKARPGRAAAQPEVTLAEFTVLTIKGDSPIQRHTFTDPVEALGSAVAYLKQGYQVRLHDQMVSYYQQLPDRFAAGNGNGASS